MDLWWLSMSWTHEWSDEETSTRTRIWALFGVFFFLIFIPAIAIFRAFGVERHTGAILAFAIAVPPGLWAGRRSCERIWPDLVSKADANAAKRLGQ
jgi:hypothetical protein